MLATHWRAVPPERWSLPHTIGVMPIEISREDLYKLVWTEPIHKLSTEYCLSDVGLAKTCRRHNIPIPPRGYWAKKQAGHQVEAASLPPDPRPGIARVSLPGKPARTAKPIVDPIPAHPLVAAEF